MSKQNIFLRIFLMHRFFFNEILIPIYEYVGPKTLKNERLEFCRCQEQVLKIRWGQQGFRKSPGFWLFMIGFPIFPRELWELNKPLWKALVRVAPFSFGVKFFTRSNKRAGIEVVSQPISAAPSRCGLILEYILKIPPKNEYWVHFKFYEIGVDSRYQIKRKPKGFCMQVKYIFKW